MTATVSGPTLEFYLGNYFVGYPLKAMLVTGSFVFNKDTHTLVTSVVGEAAGTGYVAGGVSIENVDVVLDTVNNEVRLTADPVEFGVINVTGVSQLIVYALGSATDPSRIVSVHTFTSTNISQEFTFLWPLDGAGNGVIGVFPY